MSPRRHQPGIILGGSMTRAPNGYRATIQTLGKLYPTPMGTQELYANATQRRYAPSWDGIEPAGALVVYWTDTFPISCGRCGEGFGKFAAYNAHREYGIVEHTSRHRHPIGNFPPDHFKNMPNDRFEPASKRFWISGEVGRTAGGTAANFQCRKCDVKYVRNLRRLGKRLFEERPREFALMP